jgi:hypothetical protein
MRSWRFSEYLIKLVENDLVYSPPFWEGLGEGAKHGCKQALSQREREKRP